MNVQKILKGIQEPFFKKVPDFRPGDTVRVYVKVVEGDSERIQPFEGVVLRKQGSGLTEAFTVRKISFGIGVERTFLLNSPRIEKIEITKSGRVRRSKLFYLRKLSGKAARLSEKDERDIGGESSVSAPPASSDSKPQTKPASSAAEPVASR